MLSILIVNALLATVVMAAVLAVTVRAIRTQDLDRGLMLVRARRGRIQRVVVPRDVGRGARTESWPAT
jgi:hypothetical protein